MNDGNDAELEYTLLNKNEVFVYQIPTRPSLGHRAEDWSDCIWRGKLQVVAKGDRCTIKLNEISTGNLFAQCPLPENYEDACERAIDSSRCFAVRLDDGKGKHAFVGLTFESRNDAFDFNATLSDFARRNEQEKIGNANPLTVPSNKIHKLEEGEKVTIKLKGLKPRSREKAEKNSTQNHIFNGSTPILIPPPPASGSSNKLKQKPAVSEDLLEFE